MGWNLERLEFGNRFVHVVAFLLLSAPYLVFDLAAININNMHIFFCILLLLTQCILLPNLQTTTCVGTFNFVTCLANLAQMRLPILENE